MQAHAKVKVAVLTCSFLLSLCGVNAHPVVEYGVVSAHSSTFRFVGESLDLYCNITNKDVRENSTMLHMERVTSEGADIILAEDIEILTTKAIRLRLRRLQLDDDGVYTCFQETFSGESRVIGFQSIKVDHEPQKVTDISCHVYNWEQMTCTWDLGVKFQHPEFIHVSLIWTIHGEQQDCPNLVNNSCIWDSKVYAHGYQYLMVIEVATIVEGRQLVTARSPQFRINTALHVEPAPVNNLQATVESSTCIDLTWQHSSVDWQKFFVAESRIKGEEKWHQIILNQEQEQADYHSPVCKLTPFTDYEFRMAVLPFPVETDEPVVQGYRSEWKMVSAKTLEDVPGAAPKLCPGCFHEYKCPEGRHQRCVRLYWQSLNENEKHGILTRYNVTYISMKTGQMQTLLVPVTESRLLHSADIDLPTSKQSFKIVIRAGTGQGFSRKSSSLYLPSAHRRPMPPENFLVEWDESDDDTNYRFYLSWAALTSDPSVGLKYTSVSVVWCCGHWATAECQNDISWVKLPPDQVTYELQPGSDDCHYSNFLIGITAEASHEGHMTSSGIHWNSCIYLRNQKPQNTPRNVRQSSAHPANGLTVLWDSFGCLEETSYITEYLVRYCPLKKDNECIETEKTVNISNTVNTVTLDGLKENVRYKVSVIAVSSAGLGPSEPLITQAIKGSPLPDQDLNTSVGIIVGIASVVIFLGLAIVLWRYFFYWKKKSPNMETLIQSYAQTSENYSPQKPQDFRNRPLPKTPEDQHFYGSSACMNTHGSESTKNNRHSETCSEDSVTSRTSLLLNLINSSQSPPPRNKTRTKSKKNNSKNKESKSKNSSVRKLKTLLDINPSVVNNDSNQRFSDRKSPHLHHLLPAPCQKCKHVSTTDGHHVDGLHCSHSSINVPPSSRSLARLQQSMMHNSVDCTSNSELLDSSLITFSKVSTLSVRKCGMQLPVCPLRAKLQTLNSRSASLCENHQMTADFNHGEYITNNICRNSMHNWRYRPQSQHCHSAVTGGDHLQALSQLNCSTCPSKYLTLDNTTDIQLTKRASLLCQCRNPSEPTIDTVEDKRYSVPLASFIHFPPPPTSPPPTLCCGEVQYTTDLPSTVAHSVPLTVSHGCQCRLSSRSFGELNFPMVTSTSFIDTHHVHQPFLTTQQTCQPTCQPTSSAVCPITYQYKERNARSSWTSPAAPVNTAVMCTNNLLHNSDPNSVEMVGTAEGYLYTPAVSAQTFPRNTGKDSVTLQLPSPLTRPLSGDLLDLPPEYYQDPRLDGSNLILTEL